MIGFDTLYVDTTSGNYSLKRKTQNTGFTYITPDLSLSNIAGFNVSSLVPQPNFYRLETIASINQTYSSNDLNTLTTISPATDQLLLFEAGKAFSCKTNRFLGKS